MTDMVTRVAHALTGHIAGVCCHKTGGMNDDPKCECRALARAAIEAMSTPTKAMLEAVDAEEERQGYVGYESMDAEAAWPVMISAALKENEEKA